MTEKNNETEYTIEEIEEDLKEVNYEGLNFSFDSYGNRKPPKNDWSAKTYLNIKSDSKPEVEEEN